MAWLCAKLGELSVILELATFHKNLLAFWLDAGERVELELEDFAGGFGVEVDVVLLALVLDNDYTVN